ncbi:MAG: hypothetical protein JWM16_126, partial [Verrucomicrobiales bacterium]|nr:hypothetical protein [Verrucomicrobiales bacterium]
ALAGFLSPHSMGPGASNKPAHPPKFKQELPEIYEFPLLESANH